MVVINLMHYNIKSTYCLDNETTKKLVEAAKNINPSINLQTQGVNVSVPPNLLTNVGYYGGLFTTIIRGGINCWCWCSG